MSAMDYRSLGSTGLQVSRIALGCGNFGGIGSAPEFYGQGESDEEAFAIMDAAFERASTSSTRPMPTAAGAARRRSASGSRSAAPPCATRCC